MVKLRNLASAAIEIARVKVPLANMRSSALLCITDAKTCFEREDYGHAISRARDSLYYSIGKSRAEALIPAPVCDNCEGYTDVDAARRSPSEVIVDADLCRC